MDARIGTTLGERWTLDRVLGSGGMATVYAATHRNGKRVAIKVLRPELSAIEEVRARFQREGHAANALDHPGAVEVHDDGVTDDGAAFLVLELLEGETLEARRRGGVLPVVEVLGYAAELLDVLAAAHAKGIIHRDIKPDNLFLTKDGRLKVLDFGIARVREAGTAPGTRVGSIMGTPAFMAPEQARARWDAVDARTDLWAVGATLFALLSGRLVHEADTANEELALACTQAAPSLAEVAPRLSAAVVALVDRALQPRPADRWQSACEMQAAVRQLLGAPLELEPLVPSAEPRAAPVPVAPAHGTITGSALEPALRPSTRPWVGFAVVGAGVAGLLVAGWLTLGRSSPRPAPSAAPEASTAAATTTAATASPTVEPSTEPTVRPVSVADLPTVAPRATATATTATAPRKKPPPAPSSAPKTTNTPSAPVDPFARRK